MNLGSIAGAAFPSVAGDLIGGFLSQSEGNKNRNQLDQTNRENQMLQREFAQNGIKWKIADAQSVGLSPLAAIGATEPSASMNIPDPADDSMGQTFRNVGQDISRAVMSTQDRQDRASIVAENAKNNASVRDKNSAEASYWRSMAVKNLSGPQTPGIPTSTQPMAEGYNSPSPEWTYAYGHAPGVTGIKTIADNLGLVTHSMALPYTLAEMARNYWNYSLGTRRLRATQGR
jgi:hypothetical protein